MQLVFTRHGEGEANVTQILSNRDLPHQLTATGKQQAQRLADKLRPYHIVAIYTSPILRARQTAQILAEDRQLSVLTVDALREFDCGVMEGRSDAAAWQAHQAVVRAWDDEHAYAHRIEGGESFKDLQARFVPFLEGIVDTYAATAGAMVCVSYGGLLNLMLPLVLANLDRDFTTPARKAHELQSWDIRASRFGLELRSAAGL